MYTTFKSKLQKTHKHNIQYPVPKKAKHNNCKSKSVHKKGREGEKELKLLCY